MVRKEKKGGEMVRRRRERNDSSSSGVYKGISRVTLLAPHWEGSVVTTITPWGQCPHQFPNATMCA